MGGRAIRERDGERGRERYCAVGESEECEGWTPVGEFPATGDDKPRAYCKACCRARKKRYYAEGRFTKNAEVERDRNRRYQARHKERKLRQHREYLERVKADPEKHKRLLETRRMAYRLKLEREGITPRPAKRHEDRRLIPSAPLATLIARIKEEREVVAALIDDPDYGNLAEVCRDLGTNDRHYRHWRDGSYPNVTVTVADRVLMAADVRPRDIYSPDDHLEALALLEGMKAEEVREEVERERSGA